MDAKKVANEELKQFVEDYKKSTRESLIKSWTVKLTSVLVSGVLIGVILVFNSPTLSFFSTKTEHSISVSAATIRDIIEPLRFEYEDPRLKRNPTHIIIKKSKNCTYNPILYFSIEGEAFDYLLHINPVRLDEDSRYYVSSKDEYKIPIEPNVNIIQWVKLMVTNNIIKGTLHVKYLNEFITEGDVDNLQFTKKYLRHHVRKNIDRSAQGPKEDVTNIVLSEKLTLVSERNTVYGSVYAVHISDEEEQIIDIVVPGISHYIDELEEQNKEKAKRIEALNSDIDALVKQQDRQQEEIKELREHNERLRKSLEQRATLSPSRDIVTGDDSHQTVAEEVYQQQ